MVGKLETRMQRTSEEWQTQALVTSLSTGCLMGFLSASLRSSAVLGTQVALKEYYGWTWFTEMVCTPSYSYSAEKRPRKAPQTWQHSVSFSYN